MLISIATIKKNTDNDREHMFYYSKVSISAIKSFNFYVFSKIHSQYYAVDTENIKQSIYSNLQTFCLNYCHNSKIYPKNLIGQAADIDIDIEFMLYFIGCSKTIG